MVKYGETIYGLHTALNTSCSEVKWKCKGRIAFGNKEHTKGQKPETQFYQGCTRTPFPPLASAFKAVFFLKNVLDIRLQSKFYYAKCMSTITKT